MSTVWVVGVWGSGSLFPSKFTFGIKRTSWLSFQDSFTLLLFWFSTFTDLPTLGNTHNPPTPIYSDKTHPYWIPIDANFIVAKEKQGKWSRPAFRPRGPEATCMHRQDNNPPSLLVLSQKAVYCWANGGTGTAERAQGAGRSFSLGLSHKRQLPSHPGAAGKGSAQPGLFLKTRAHGRKRRGRKRGTERQADECALNLKSLTKEGCLFAVADLEC